MQVTEFEVVDHGIDGAQYFQGCGVSFTRFEHCVTGNGDTFAEAVDDALECMAQGPETRGTDFEALSTLIMADAPKNEESASELYPGEDSEMYYYVSIRYNVGSAAEVKV